MRANGSHDLAVRVRMRRDINARVTMLAVNHGHAGEYNCCLPSLKLILKTSWYALSFVDPNRQSSRG